jgi:16S rRNA (cytosine967-C5)-methyltransferase
VSARRAAAELLVAVLDEGQPLGDALAHTQSFADLSGRDRAFARAMAAAALRRLGGLDAVIAQFLQKPLPETAAHGRAMLRIGAAQLLLMDTPAHAAVGETVEAANSMSKSRGFAKLINAVLRKIAAEGAALLAAQPPGTDLPAWLFTRWRATYGGETAAAIALALRNEPPLDVSAKADARDWAKALGAQLTATGSLRLREAAPVDTLPGFDEGTWWVQDAAAALPALLLGDVRGKTVLDLCAAPGGKTLQLAAAGATVTAVDRSDERLGRLRENLARTQLTAKVIARDALSLRIKEPFDAVLLDAPCSSTGTLRRHPDVAWLRRPSDIRTLSDLQTQLLDAARNMVRPGGVLVYAVCSLEPEEGPAIAAHALKNGWTRRPIARGELEGGDEFITADGDLRTLPSQWPEIGGLDGFYAVRLVRASDG